MITFYFCTWLLLLDLISPLGRKLFKCPAVQVSQPVGGGSPLWHSSAARCLFGFLGNEPSDMAQISAINIHVDLMVNGNQNLPFW